MTTVCSRKLWRQEAPSPPQRVLTILVLAKLPSGWFLLLASPGIRYLPESGAERSGVLWVPDPAQTRGAINAGRGAVPRRPAPTPDL